MTDCSYTSGAKNETFQMLRKYSLFVSPTHFFPMDWDIAFLKCLLLWKEKWFQPWIGQRIVQTINFKFLSVLNDIRECILGVTSARLTTSTYISRILRQLTRKKLLYNRSSLYACNFIIQKVIFSIVLDLLSAKGGSFLRKVRLICNDNHLFLPFILQLIQLPNHHQNPLQEVAISHLLYHHFLFVS